MSDDCLVDRLAAELLEAEIGKPPRYAEEFCHVVWPDAFGGVLPYESRRPRKKVRCRGGRYRRLSFNDLDRPYQKRRGGFAKPPVHKSVQSPRRHIAKLFVVWQNARKRRVA